MRHSQRPSVCVAIPTYNRESVLINTIKQVLVQKPPADEVLVIDQTQRHESETSEYLQQAHGTGRIRWIRHSPANLNGARNRAIVETTCKVLIFIDDDVELVPSFVDKHTRNYSDPEIAAVCGKVIQANGNVPADRQQPWLRQLSCNRYSGWGPERVVGIAGLWGGNHSLRVSVVREHGGFDENFFGYLYDESDLAIRLWRTKSLIVYDPDAELFHYGAPAGGCRTVSNQRSEYWMSYSSLYFHMKHFCPGWYFWQQALFVQVRRRALRREIVFRPWLIPWAAMSYGYSFLLAIRMCVTGPKYISENGLKKGQAEP